MHRAHGIDTTPTLLFTVAVCLLPYYRVKGEHRSKPTDEGKNTFFSQNQQLAHTSTVRRGHQKLPPLTALDRVVAHAPRSWSHHLPLVLPPSLLLLPVVLNRWIYVAEFCRRCRGVVIWFGLFLPVANNKQGVRFGSCRLSEAMARGIQVARGVVLVWVGRVLHVHAELGHRHGGGGVGRSHGRGEEGIRRLVWSFQAYTSRNHTDTDRRTHTNTYARFLVAIPRLPSCR